MQTYNGGLLTITVSQPLKTWTQEARRYPNKILGALQNLSNGNWGALDPSVIAHNEKVVRNSEFEAEILGIYGDIVVIGTLCRSHLTRTGLGIQNPSVMTIEQGADDPVVCKILLKPVEEVVS